LSSPTLHPSFVSFSLAPVHCYALQCKRNKAKGSPQFLSGRGPPDGMPSNARLATGDGLVCTCYFSDSAFSLSCMHSFRRPVVVSLLSCCRGCIVRFQRFDQPPSGPVSPRSLTSSHRTRISFRFILFFFLYSTPVPLFDDASIPLSCRLVSSRCFVRASCMHACFPCAFLIDTA
jgi:hypothetical protein